MQLIFLYNFFIEQLYKCIETSKNNYLYDHKFKFLQVHGIYPFNYRLLFKKGFTPVCLTLRFLKQINRGSPPSLL